MYSEEKFYFLSQQTLGHCQYRVGLPDLTRMPNLETGYQIGVYQLSSSIINNELIGERSESAPTSYRNSELNLVSLIYIWSAQFDSNAHSNPAVCVGACVKSYVVTISIFFDGTLLTTMLSPHLTERQDATLMIRNYWN